VSDIDDLQKEIEASTTWPLKREVTIRRRIRRFAAFRDADPVALRPADWDRDYEGKGRPYIVDPLAGRISGVWADMLFGEPPTFTAERDQERLENLVRENDLPTALQRAERICSSEGEVWGLIVSDPGLPNAVIEWHSRCNVIPLWRSGKLVAVAFESVLAGDSEKEERYRYIELQGKGVVRNNLYRGTKDRLGTAVDLRQRPETEQLKDVVSHGLPVLLAGRIVNELGLDPRVGISDYQAVDGMLVALNEATTIGVENARLTAKRRIVVPQRFLNEQGKFPAGADVIVSTQEQVDPDRPGEGLAQIEWEFDAEALIAYTNDLVDKILTRRRVAPQLVGRNTEGAQTGPALRARLLDSTLAASGKGRHWDDELPRLLSSAALIENLSREQGGLGIGWSDPAQPPTVSRSSILPEDENALSERLAAEVNAEMLSRRSAIEERHPTWDEDRVTEELQRIEADAPPPIQ
jgi:hypothetical protein